MAVMGRPTKFNQDVADYICEQLSMGRSLKDICDESDMPSRPTIYRWTYHHPDFSIMYDRAREERAETLADEIINIADETHSDYMTNDNGNEVINHEAIARSRLKVDARKWVASKLKPRTYGDKIQTENTNKNIDLSEMGDDELDRKLKQLES